MGVCTYQPSTSTTASCWSVQYDNTSVALDTNTAAAFSVDKDTWASASDKKLTASNSDLKNIKTSINQFFNGAYACLRDSSASSGNMGVICYRYIPAVGTSTDPKFALGVAEMITYQSNRTTAQTLTRKLSQGSGAFQGDPKYYNYDVVIQNGALNSFAIATPLVLAAIASLTF